VVVVPVTTDTKRPCPEKQEPETGIWMTDNGNIFCLLFTAVNVEKILLNLQRIKKILSAI
jgi:hypothetical protein